MFDYFAIVMDRARTIFTNDHHANKTKQRARTIFTNDHHANKTKQHAVTLQFCIAAFSAGGDLAFLRARSDQGAFSQEENAAEMQVRSASVAI
jgi:hypothetical protein